MTQITLCAIGFLLLIPTFAYAKVLDCPNAAMVLAADHAPSSGVSLARLGSRISVAMAADVGDDTLRTVTSDLRHTVPKASDAEIADLMAAGYCLYLSSDAPAEQRSEASVRVVETRIDDAVFGSEPRPDSPPRGWLYGG